MIRSFLLVILVSLSIAASVMGGEEKSETRELARELLTAGDQRAKELAGQLKVLPDEKRMEVFSHIRSEYRSLAESSGATTPLAVAGTYEVDRSALFEACYASNRKRILLEAGKAGGLTEERIAEIDEGVRRGATMITDAEFKDGNPMVITLRTDGTFYLTQANWGGAMDKQGKWALEGQQLKFKISRVGERPRHPADPHKAFEARLLRWGTLELNRKNFQRKSDETWILIRK